MLVRTAHSSTLLWRKKGGRASFLSACCACYCYAAVFCWVPCLYVACPPFCCLPFFFGGVFYFKIGFPESRVPSLSQPEPEHSADSRQQRSGGQPCALLFPFRFESRKQGQGQGSNSSEVVVIFRFSRCRLRLLSGSLQAGDARSNKGLQNGIVSLVPLDDNCQLRGFGAHPFLSFTNASIPDSSFRL